MRIIEFFASFGMLALFAFLYAGPPLSALLKKRPADLASIRATYEGLTSPLGPYCKVKSIEPAGSGGSRNAARRYRVVIERAGGEVVTRFVYVGAGLFNDGDIRDDRV